MMIDDDDGVGWHTTITTLRKKDKSITDYIILINDSECATPSNCMDNFNLLV